MQEESGPSMGACAGLRKWLGTAPETRDELFEIGTRFTSLLRTRYSCHARRGTRLTCN